MSELTDDTSCPPETTRTFTPPWWAITAGLKRRAARAKFDDDVAYAAVQLRLCLEHFQATLMVPRTTNLVRARDALDLAQKCAQEWGLFEDDEVKRTFDHLRTTERLLNFKHFGIPEAFHKGLERLSKTQLSTRSGINMHRLVLHTMYVVAFASVMSCPSAQWEDIWWPILSVYPPERHLNDGEKLLIALLLQKQKLSIAEVVFRSELRRDRSTIGAAINRTISQALEREDRLPALSYLVDKLKDYGFGDQMHTVIERLIGKQRLTEAFKLLVFITAPEQRAEIRQRFARRYINQDDLTEDRFRRLVWCTTAQLVDLTAAHLHEELERERTGDSNNPDAPDATATQSAPAVSSET